MKPIERFKNLIKLDKKDIYQIVLYSIFGGLISLSLPLGIQSIVNLIQAGKISTSWVILIIFVVIGVIFVGIFKIMQFRISENLQQKIFVRSSFEFAYRFPKIKHEQLYNQYPPELANRFFDTLTVQKGLSKLLLDSSTAILQIIFGLILLALYHSFFIFFGIVLSFLLYYIFKFNFNSGIETSLKESKYKYKVAHWIQEIARNNLSFKNENLFEFSLDKNDKYVTEYLKHRESHFQILKKQFIQLVGFKTLITAGLLIIGGLLVLNQQMNIGQFVAAEIIILTIINAVEKLFSVLELFYDVLTSLEKIGTVVDLEIEKDANNKQCEYLEKDLNIELKDINYKYPDSESLILQNVNLKINQGDKIVINGSNGSGKTTLMRLLAKIINPTSGTIFINDTNSKRICLDEIRSKISIITYNQGTFEGTILENLTFNNQLITMTEVKEVLNKVMLTDFIKSLPNGLDTKLCTDGKQINSSVVQKILIARAILMKPRILLLEDSLSKVEPNQTKQIINYLFEEQKDLTVVVITNNKDWETSKTKTYSLTQGKLKD